MRGEGQGPVGPEADSSAQLIRSLSLAECSDPELAFSPSFVLRSRSGRLEHGIPDKARARFSALGRLRHLVRVGRLEAIGAGYLVVSPRPGGRPGDGGNSWLLRVQDHRLAVAFEFERRPDAVKALPPRLRRLPAVELVETGIWAFVDRDISTLLSILAPDFTYNDLARDLSFEGPSTAIGLLAMVHGDLAERGFAIPEIEQTAEGIVMATGLLVDPQPPLDPDLEWRWTVLVGVEDGLIKWTVRHPDQVAGGTEPQFDF